MSHKFSINPNSRTIYVSENGVDSDAGISLETSKNTVAVSMTTADALTPVTGDPVAIADPGASTYAEDVVVSDNVFMDMINCRMVGAGGTGTTVTGGANATAAYLTIQTNGGNGGVAFSTGGKSRMGLVTPSLILNGTNQTGILIDGSSNQIFLDISQILSQGADNTLVSHISSEAQSSFTFNEWNSSENGLTGLSYNSTSSDAAEYRGGAIRLTGTGTIGIHGINGNMAAYVNIIEAEDAIIVESGMIVSIFDADVVGDITINAGGTLNCTINSHTGTLINNGTLIGRIGNKFFRAPFEIEGDLDVSGKVGVGGVAVDASAQFEVSSASRGFLMPRMTTAERDNISSPATGLEIFNITTNAPEYFDGSAWAGTAGNETLAQTLANGTQTGGNNIVISNGDAIESDTDGNDGTPLLIRSGFGINSAGFISISVGVTDNGPGADWTRTAGPGGTDGGTGPGGNINDISGSGNSNNQKSGDLHYKAGNPDGSGAFGTIFLQEDGGNVVVGTDKTYAARLTVREDSASVATNIISAIINENTTDNNWAEQDFKGVDSAASIFTAARIGVQITDHNAATKSADYVIKTTHNNILSEGFRISDDVVSIPKDLDIQSGGPTVTVRNTADFGRADLDLYGSRNAGDGNAELGSVSMFNTRSGADVMVARIAFVNGASGTSAGGIQLLTKENADGSLSVRVFVDDAGNVLINGEVASRVAPAAEEIFDTSDFDELATGGVITVDGVSLSNIFKDSITSTNRFNVINGGRLTQRFDAAWTYSGTGTALTVATGGTINIKDGAIFASSSATLFDITSASTVTFSNMTSLFFGEYGTIQGTDNVLMSTNGFFGGNGPLNLIDNASTAISSLGMSSATPVSGALVRVSGLSTGFFDFSASNIALQPGESFIRFDPDAPILQATLDKIRAVGGELFDTTGGIQEDFTAVADASIGATAVDVTNEGGFARFSFTGPTTYVNQRVITSTFTTNPDYNATFIIPATDGTAFFDSKILYGSDESGSFLSKSITLTITATTLSNGDTGVIDTVLSIDFLGGTTFYNKLTNSVQANIPEDKDFTTTHPGSVNTAGLDSSDPRILAFNNPGSVDSKYIAASHVNNNTFSIAGASITNNTFRDMLFGEAGNALLVGSTMERFKLTGELNGEHTYIGNEPFAGSIPWSFFSSSAGGSVKFRYKWVIDPDGGGFVDFPDVREMPVEIGSVGAGASGSQPMLLKFGDKIKPVFTRNSGSSDFLTEYAQIG